MRLAKSTRRHKKYQIEVHGRPIHFGAEGYEDFTTHKDPARKARYLKRHSKEDWSADGIDTAGFWARWILWNKATIEQSVRDVNKRFGLRVHLDRTLM